VALRCQAVLETLRGRSDAARRMIASSRRMVEELGITQRLLEADQFAGLIELLEDDAVAAELWLSKAYEGFREHGLGVAAAQAAAQLGRALLAQGRAAEAEALSHESEALAGDDFKAAIAWRGVRAEALAGRGESEAAVDLARAAVEIAAATDDPLGHADARSALAVALRAAGRSSEADAEMARAIELWEQKGATLLAERARRGVRVAPAERAPDARIELPRPEPRRVRANRATEAMARLDAAIAARDAAALDALFAAGGQALQHPIGFSEPMRSLYSAVLGIRDLTWQHEPIGTLGDSLALFRSSISGSEVARGESFDVGAYDLENPVVIEVDADGRCRAAEYFAPERLGDAIARLYERHAELLPEGPERARAAATARSVTAMLDPPDVERYRAAIAPGAEFVDHRTLGLGSARGADWILRGTQALLEVAENLTTRIEDILALRADTLLVRRTNFGSERVGGGTYERPFLLLLILGADGLVSRWEHLDAEREAEALARFDELTAEPQPVRPIRRRVRPNGMTALVARQNAAMAARDADALLPLLSEDLQLLHHSTGAILGRQALVDFWRLPLAQDRDCAFQVKPLATLGPSLVLCRQSWSGSGYSDAAFDVGPYQRDAFSLVEGDPEGRAERVEVFDPNRLGDAIARLYERYAELLPEGPERVRAAAIARSVATVLGPYDVERYTATHAPDIAYVDHRTYGIGSLTGPEAVAQWFTSLLELAEGVTNRHDDVMALRSDALLLRWTNLGTEGLAGGGPYERHFLWLGVCGSDGLVTHIELFEADRDAEALARFDELTAESPPARLVRRRVRPNAATENATRVNAAMAAHDADGLAALASDGLQGVHHMTGVVLDRQAILAWQRLFFSDRDAAFRLEPFATLGTSLALCRQSWTGIASADAVFEIGAFERDALVSIEADDQARSLRFESFAPDRLGDAIVRLYERYAELLPVGPERARAAATARSIAGWVGPFDLERAAAPAAPTFESVDHRTLGTWSAQGKEAWVEHMRALVALAEGIVLRDDDVLGLRPDALLVQRVQRGTDRVSGGVYERPYLMLQAFDADGLVARIEWFDVDRAAEALARFDEQGAQPPPVRPVRRRVRPNAATANAARLEAAVVARDAEAMAGLLSDDAASIEHTTGTSYDRRGLLVTWRSMLRARDARHREEPLATLGDSLALCSESFSAAGYSGRTIDVAAYEREELILIEVDAQGRRRWSEAFAAHHLGDAIARLYERYAELLPEGPERARAALAAGLFRAVQRYDLDRIAASLAPDVEYVDHRVLGFPRTRGAEAYMRRLGSLWEVATDLRARIEDVLALGADACLVRWVNYGIDRAGGGAFEVPFFLLWVFGADGLVTHNEPFDIGHEAEALARFDELTGAKPATPFANAAWRAVEALDRAMERRDWDALVALAAPGLVMDDRRSLVRTRVEGEASLANLRLIFDSWRSLSRQRLATRGERLVLDRQLRTSVDRHGGLAEFEYLCLNELDATGRLAASVMFDPGDLDAAYAELDARYEATRRVPFLRAVAARDWDAVAALLAPDFVSEDHRLLGRGTHGAAAYVAFLRTLPELAPDARLRVEHMEDSGRGALAIAAVRGTWEGGAFETSVVVVSEADVRGRRIRRLDSYDLDQLPEARARFAELAAAPQAPWLENAATRSSHRFCEMWADRDLEGIAAELPPGFRLIDRRSYAQLDLDLEQHLESLRVRLRMSSSRFTSLPLATRGDRLALSRQLFELADGDVGPSESESLCISEVDERGKSVATVMFDPDDLDAAYAELDERYGATKVTTRLLQGIAARDWDAVASLLAPDFLIDDHRLLGWGTLHGPAFVDLLKALVELAPDARLRFDHLEDSRRGAFGISMLAGTREGGAFEDRRVVVSELDAEGKVRRLEFYDLDRLDEARTRFEALFANAPHDPLAALVKPNAATAALGRLQAAFDARDWAALRAVAAEGARFEDRRRHARVAGDVDWWIADLKRVVAEAYIEDVHYQQTLVATAGDRVCLERVLFSGGPAERRVEIECLWLAEVDASGRLVAGVMFDPDDRRAAMRDGWARWLAHDAAAAALMGPFFEAIERYNDHDRPGMRAVLADDLVVHDRRLAGQGQVDGADAYMDSFAVLWGLAPDIQLEPRCVLALERHGAVFLSHTFGTLADGGGAFERYIVHVVTVARGRLTRLEQFEIDAAAAALARLAELRPDPLRIPPNAATRAGDLRHAAWQARDWDALRALASPDFRFEDRSRISQVSGGVEMWIENNRFVEPASGERELIATAGDRISLERVLWRGEPDGAPVEREHLRLTEVDAEGWIRAAIRFDPEDRAAAFAEAGARFTAGEAAAVGGQARILAFASATRQHDWEACRSCLAEGFVLWDRRAPGVLGTLDRDQWVESLRAAVDLATDFNFELLRILTWSCLGRVHQVRMVGTRDGGPFENTFLSVMLVNDDRIQRNELFDVADADRALARFEELCAALP
jgi:ketosteroid isomerase-like protein